MKITREDVVEIYEAAGIVLKEDSIELLTEKFSELLAFDEKIMALDTTDIPFMELNNNADAVLREDEVHSGITREEALKNAQDIQYGYFRLNRVLE